MYCCLSIFIGLCKQGDVSSPTAGTGAGATAVRKRQIESETQRAKGKRKKKSFSAGDEEGGGVVLFVNVGAALLRETSEREKRGGSSNSKALDTPPSTRNANWSRHTMIAVATGSFYLEGIQGWGGGGQ
jgi:hypothetical protein